MTLVEEWFDPEEWVCNYFLIGQSVKCAGVKDLAGCGEMLHTDICETSWLKEGINDCKSVSWAVDRT